MKESSDRKWRRVAVVFLLLPILYVFICSLETLSKGFQLLAGKSAGELWSHTILKAYSDILIPVSKEHPSK